MRLLRLMICGQHGDLPGGSGQGQAGCGRRTLLQRSPATSPGATRSFTVSWLLRAGDASPRSWGRLPLTYFGWPVPEPWAKTHSSPGPATYLRQAAEGPGWQGPGAGGCERSAPWPPDSMAQRLSP
ncbi:unnamed protein product, partial [Gulo gulo]